MNQSDVPPGGGPGESVRALDDRAENTAGIVATDEAVNTESIEVGASITEEQVPVVNTTKYAADARRIVAKVIKTSMTGNGGTF